MWKSSAVLRPWKLIPAMVVELVAIFVCTRSQKKHTRHSTSTLTNPAGASQSRFSEAPQARGGPERLQRQWCSVWPGNLVMGIPFIFFINRLNFAPLFCNQQCHVFVTLVQPTSNDHALRQSSTCSTRSRSVTTLIRRFTIACCLSTPKLAVKIFSVMPVRRTQVSFLSLMISIPI